MKILLNLLFFLFISNLVYLLTLLNVKNNNITDPSDKKNAVAGNCSLDKNNLPIRKKAVAGYCFL